MATIFMLRQVPLDIGHLFYLEWARQHETYQSYAWSELCVIV